MADGSIASRSGANGDGVGAGGGEPSMVVVGVAAGAAGCCGSGVIPSDRRSSSSWFGLRVGVGDGPATAAGLRDAGATEQAVTRAATASVTRTG